MIANITLADHLNANTQGYEALRKQTEEALLNVPEPATRLPSDRILRSLFPAWSALTEHKPLPGMASSEDWAAHRICHRDAFDYYFRLSIPEGGISPSDVDAVLSLAANAESFCDALAQLSSKQASDGITKFRKFLEYARHRMAIVATPELDHGLVTAIFSCGDGFCNNAGQLDILSLERQLFWRLAEDALRRINDAEDRLRVITQAFRNGKAICLMAFSIEFWRAQPEQEKLLEESEVDKLQKIALERIELAAKNGTLRNAPYLRSVLKFLTDAGNPETASSCAKKLAEEDSGLADLLSAAVTGIYVSNGRSSYTFDHAFVDQYIGLAPEALRSRCEQRLAQSPGWMTPDKRTAITDYLKTPTPPRN